MLLRQRTKTAIGRRQRSCSQSVQHLAHIGTGLFGRNCIACHPVRNGARKAEVACHGCGGCRESRRTSGSGPRKRGEGQEDFWQALGAAFPHQDGKGFNIVLQALPIDGKIVLREPQEDDREQPALRELLHEQSVLGKEPGMVHGSLHGPSTTASTSDLTSTFALPAGQNFSDDFHLYAVEWDPTVVRFYVDANPYATFNSSQWPAGGKWVFDHPFFIILNVAVGGDWPGSPDNGIFPQTMLIDYVRVYKKN